MHGDRNYSDDITFQLRLMDFCAILNVYGVSLRFFFFKLCSLVKLIVNERVFLFFLFFPTLCFVVLFFFPLSLSLSVLLSQFFSPLWDTFRLENCRLLKKNDKK